VAEHRVTWQIDVEASSALEAARQARRLQVVPYTTARVFDVVPAGSSQEQAEHIDLCKCTSEGPEPSDILLDVIEAFPGLVDGDTEVSGADLVEFLTQRLRQLHDLADFVSEARLDTEPE
jgi:hypothetical protein